jgi:hypothetical protein
LRTKCATATHRPVAVIHFEAEAARSELALDGGKRWIAGAALHRERQDGNRGNGARGIEFPVIVDRSESRYSVACPDTYATNNPSPKRFRARLE